MTALMKGAANGGEDDQTLGVMKLLLKHGANKDHQAEVRPKLYRCDSLVELNLVCVRRGSYMVGRKFLDFRVFLQKK